MLKVKVAGKHFELPAIIILFALITVYHFWDVIPFEPGLLHDHFDQLLHVWILGWDYNAILSRPLDIFNSNFNFPTPNTLALSDHLLGLLPFWYVAYLMTGDYVAAHNYTFLFGHVVTGIAAYYYFRYLKINWAVAVIGAVLFSFFMSNFYMDQIQLSYFGYSFLVFLFIEKYSREGKRRFIFYMTIIYILGFLTGFYFAYMLTIAMVIYISVTHRMRRDILTFRKLAVITFSFILSLLILYPTISPYIKLHKSGVIPFMPTEEILFFSQSIDNYSLLFHMMLTIIVSIYLILKTGSEKRLIMIFMIISMVFHLLSLGPYLKVGNKNTGIPMLYQLFTLLPGFNAIRAANRFRLMAYVGEVSVILLFLNSILFEKYKFKFMVRNLPQAVVILIIFILQLYILGSASPILGENRYRSLGKDQFSPVPTADNLPVIYKYMMSLKEEGAIVEFPLVPSLRLYNHLYQYFSLYHGRYIFNGTSGYIPYGNTTKQFENLLILDTPLEDLVLFFHVIGVKFLVSHPPDFIIKVIERSWQSIDSEFPPLPAPSQNRKSAIVWMNPIEKSIFVNGLVWEKLWPVLSPLGIDKITNAMPADAGKDKFVIDLGHNLINIPKEYSIPPLPPYTTRAENILFVDYKDLENMMAYLGPMANYILLQHGIDRIVVSGFRLKILENINNAFYNLSEADGKLLGLIKVAEAEGNVIWRIMPHRQIIFTNKTYLKFDFTISDDKKMKIVALIGVPPGTVWKNSNPYGIIKGNIVLRMVGYDRSFKHEVYLRSPLAVTERMAGRCAAEFSVDDSLQPGFFYISASFPELSPETLTFTTKVESDKGVRSKYDFH